MRLVKCMGRRQPARERKDTMDNIKAKAAELKKLLAETYGIRNDADLERELAKQSLDISLFVLPPGKGERTA